jgi:predicted nucleic acid-binding protein
LGSLIVFDADVLIAFFAERDAHHERAIAVVRGAVDANADLAISAVNFSEVLVWPIRQGGDANAERLSDRVRRLRIEIVPADTPLAVAAASARSRTGLKLPDAFAVSTALAATRTYENVRLESFDDRVVAAFEQLR